MAIFHFATKTCLHLSQGGVSAKCHSRVKFLWPNSNLLETGSIRGLLNFSHGPKYRPHCYAEKGQFVLNLVGSRQCRCYNDVVFRLRFATGRFPGTGAWQPTCKIIKVDSACSYMSLATGEKWEVSPQWQLAHSLLFHQVWAPVL